MWIDHRGYCWICVDGVEVLEHRHIMEQELGRKLDTDETVHHINGIKADNRRENLELKSRAQHQSDHRDHHIPCRICGRLDLRKDGRGYQGSKGLCSKHYQQSRANHV